MRMNWDVRVIIFPSGLPTDTFLCKVLSVMTDSHIPVSLSVQQSDCEGPNAAADFAIDIPTRSALAHS